MYSAQVLTTELYRIHTYWPENLASLRREREDGQPLAPSEANSRFRSTSPQVIQLGESRPCCLFMPA